MTRDRNPTRHSSPLCTHTTHMRMRSCVGLGRCTENRPTVRVHQLAISSNALNSFSLQLYITIVKMLVAALLLPLIAALQLPHFPTSPQEALQAADSILHGSPNTQLSPASDISLADLRGGDDFVTLTSTRHPGHSVRIKETTGWCDPHVRSFTG